MEPSNMVSDYEPTPEEQQTLKAIPRDFILYSGLGFAGASTITHFLVSRLLPNTSKQSYALRYGAPVGIGLLVGAFVGLNKIQTHLQHIAYDLPPSPLTNVYRNKFVRYRSPPSSATENSSAPTSDAKDR